MGSSSGFLLFIPDVDKPQSDSEEQLWRRLGVWDFFDGVGSAVTNAGTGPAEGKSGIIVAPQCPHQSGGTPAMVEWNPEKQNWVPLEHGKEDGIYIGWWKDRPPHPRDLKRPRMFDGDMVVLGDGHEWQIPIIHMPTDEFFHPQSTLPQAMYRVQDNGHLDVETKVKGDYLQLVERSNEWVDRIIAYQDAAAARDEYNKLDEQSKKDRDPPGLPRWATPIEEFDWIADCVKVNYRIDPRVCEGDVLGLASTDTFFKLLNASLGMEQAAKN
jgi:hypothetical protein